MNSPSIKSPRNAGEAEQWFDDACVVDMDHFAKTLADVKAKGARPDLLGSIISHYASKWLPELSAAVPAAASTPQHSTAAWLKKRFFVETLAGLLPAERGAVPCGFLLRLLRAASMVGAAPPCVAELETRAAEQLEEAALQEVMIPAFSHTCGTLLDVGMVLRLVRRFATVGELVKVAKVARLVDEYLAEAALDAGLEVAEFEELARAVPAHARGNDDGLYRAVDTYLKVHATTITKEERKALCKLIDTRKLSSEASHHASQNERLPIRTVIQVLFSEQSSTAKLCRSAEWSGSFSSSRSQHPALDAPGRVPSKRETLALQQEVRRLRDDVSRLQLHCHALQAQVERMDLEGRRRGRLFRWTTFLFKSKDVTEGYEGKSAKGKKIRLVQGRGTTPECRNSMSREEF